MRTVTAALVALLLAATVATEQQRPQDVELQAAIRTATVDGDLEKAAKLFAAIADTYKADRATAATALLHLADVYQKRGDMQAKSVYQRILKEYGDQKVAVAIARAKLGNEAGRSTEAMTYRRVWAVRDMPPNADPNGTVSPDGRYLSYTDWTAGDLMLRDLQAGTSRRLTGNGSWPASNEYAEQSAISRDGRKIAYSWFDGKSHYQLRVGELNGAALEPRTILAEAGIGWIAPHDWLPDSQSVVVVLTRAGRKTEVALVGLDGSVRTLATTGWRGPWKASVSPDSRLVAFDRDVSQPAFDECDIFAVDLASGEERPLVANPGLDRVMGWSHDGSALLFASDRSGALGLWSQRISDRTTASASPELLKAEIGERALGATAAGALVVANQVAGSNIYVAEVDFARGVVTKPAERVVDRFVGMNEAPDWSRDGRFLSYVYARHHRGRGSAIAIRSLADGRVREIPLDLPGGQLWWPTWAPDGKSFAARGVAGTGRAGIYRIDAGDGGVTPLIVPEHAQEEPIGLAEYSPDGRKLYFGRAAGNVRIGIEYELESGRSREVIRLAGLGPQSISPDGKSVAVIQREPRSSALLVVSLDGASTPRAVLRAAHPQVLMGKPAWAPDGSGLMLNTFWNDGERRETWWVPLNGGPHKVLDLPGHSWSWIRVHPDGKRVAYHAGEMKSEVWVLENFLPAK